MKAPAQCIGKFHMFVRLNLMKSIVYSNTFRVRNQNGSIDRFLLFNQYLSKTISCHPYHPSHTTMETQLRDLIGLFSLSASDNE